jgi:hypothetical protein
LAARSGELRCVPLAWTAAPEEDVTRYEVFRAEGTKADWVKIATVKGRTETHYLDGGKNPGNLPDGAEYRYRVIAVNGVEARGAPCAEVVARTRPPPPAVKSLETVSGQPRLVTLTWWASEDERVTGYELARAEGAGEFAPIGKQTGLDHCAYRDAGSHGEKPSLKDGTRYRYRVRALHPTGATSEWSEIAEAVTKPVPATPAAPAAVSGLAGRVELSWPANPETDIARYALWAADRESSSYKVIGVTEKATFAEQGLKPGKERWYRVQAIDRDGLESLLSASVRGSSKAVPAAPAGLAAAQDGEGIVLAWTPPAQTDIVRYRILEQKFLGRAEIAEAREPRHRFSTREIGKGKKVLVQAIDADGLEGEVSAPVEIKGMP